MGLVVTWGSTVKNIYDIFYQMVTGDIDVNICKYNLNGNHPIKVIYKIHCQIDEQLLALIYCTFA